MNAVLNFFDTPLGQTAMRLLVAMLCGGAVGLERELKRKPAGLRTNVLICMGAALLTITSRHIGGGAPYTDPARLVAQAVTGIGFLGAGVIMQSRASVVGLTTAATIFLVMAVGISAGDGMFATAFLATTLVIFVLVSLRGLERWIVRTRRLYQYTFKTRNPAYAHAKLLDLVESEGIHLDDFNLRELGDGVHEIGLSIVTSPDGYRRLLDKMSELGVELRASIAEKED